MVRQIRACAALAVAMWLFAGYSWSQSTAPAKAQGSTDDLVVAIVHGREIRASEVDSYIAPQLHELRQNIYDLQRNMLETLVQKLVVEEEAKTRGISVEELRQLLTAHISVTPDEVADAYASAASRTPTGIPDGN
jgi:hypothetical protein